MPAFVFMSAAAVSPLVVRRRILDLGCGSGRTLAKFGWLVGADEQVVGVDIRSESLRIARQDYPQRCFLSARGENLPFPDASFETVLCHVALPYMDISKALSEIERVLVPGGTLRLALHDWHFAMAELRRAWPHPNRTLFRTYVLTNGLLFHFTGKSSLTYFKHRVESFQTEHGMRRALERSGFTSLSFRRENTKFLVDACKPAPSNASSWHPVATVSVA
jgi:ubiquinone/menaquinone biosynthesis C-methylase UbiE